MGEKNNQNINNQKNERYSKTYDLSRLGSIGDEGIEEKPVLSGGALDGDGVPAYELGRGTCVSADFLVGPISDTVRSRIAGAPGMVNFDLSNPPIVPTGFDGGVGADRSITDADDSLSFELGTGLRVEDAPPPPTICGIPEGGESDGTWESALNRF